MSFFFFVFVFLFVFVFVVFQWTPLHIAAGEGYQDAVEYLVESNADINAEDIDNVSVSYTNSSGGRLVLLL